MITHHRVTDARCNSCQGNDRVVQFKIETCSSSGQLVRFCFDCRETMRDLLNLIRASDNAPRPTTACPPDRHPNTENVRARQAAGQPVSFLESIQARPPELDVPFDSHTLDRSAEINAAWEKERSTRKPSASTRKKPPATRKKPRKGLLDRVAEAMVKVPAKKARK